MQRQPLKDRILSFLGQKPKITTLENGTIVAGSEGFRRLYAFKTDGTALVYVPEAYKADVMEERLALSEEGLIPSPGDVLELSASLEQIATAYNARKGVEVATKTSQAPTMANRIYDILARAAELRAQDVKFIMRAHSMECRYIAAGREHTFEGISNKSEGKQVFALLFNKRDKGSGNSNLQDRAFQSFSISSTDTFRLPPSIKKLRGQKGYHETREGIEDHMVLRLFYAGDNKDTGTLADLGFDEEIKDALRYMRRKPDGALIVGGKTGDGKSTTLIRSVEQLHKDRAGGQSIVSIEDPVETLLELDGIIQIPLSSTGQGEEREDNYSAALSHFLRIHPHMGLVGEMRDKNAAKKVLEFVASGHTVYTTLHVRSAVTIPFRLINLGVAPHELAEPDVLRVLLKQSLIQELCPHCALTDAPDDIARDTDQDAAHFNNGGFKRRNPQGCAQCVKTQDEEERKIWGGYKRVRAVGEVILVDDTFREFIAQNNALEAKRYWLKPQEEGGLGGRVIGQKLFELCKAGRVDVRDAVLLGMDDYLTSRSPNTSGAITDAAHTHGDTNGCDTGLERSADTANETNALEAAPHDSDKAEVLI